MTHPLTDEICKQIVEDNVYWDPDLPVLDLMEKTDFVCMRASYDMGQKDGIEQVIAWLKQCAHNKKRTTNG